MIISARVHYACLAMLELSLRCGEQADSDSAVPVALREITDRHGVPGPFLVQIFRALRSVGWVQSIRGSQGGYRLTIDPKQITLLDIAEAMGCQEGSCHQTNQSTELDQMLGQVWERAGEASRDVLNSIRLSDLSEQCRDSDASMFYI